MKTATAIAIIGLGSTALAQSVTSVIPEPAGTQTSDSAISISGAFDGGMVYYDRSPRVCEQQEETGRDDAMFILEDGASISNVIIGPDQAEGIHCLGACTITNVFFADVCEDAITLEGDATCYVNGGGAWHAEDKIIQVNGRSSVEVSNYYCEDYGKLVRSCGNCDDNGGPRNVVIDNVVGVDGGVLCGINTNYGDTCAITNSCASEGDFCDLFEGNSDGSEPPKIGSGPDGVYCTTSGTTEDC